MWEAEGAGRRGWRRGGEAHGDLTAEQLSELGWPRSAQGRARPGRPSMHHPGPQPDGHTRRRGLTRAITSTSRSRVSSGSRSEGRPPRPGSRAGSGQSPRCAARPSTAPPRSRDPPARRPAWRGSDPAGDEDREPARRCRRGRRVHQARSGMVQRSSRPSAVGCVIEPGTSSAHVLAGPLTHAPSAGPIDTSTSSTASSQTDPQHAPDLPARAGPGSDDATLSEHVRRTSAQLTRGMRRSRRARRGSGRAGSPAARRSRRRCAGASRDRRPSGPHLPAARRGSPPRSRRSRRGRRS